jgi:hypothetical protein
MRWSAALGNRLVGVTVRRERRWTSAGAIPPGNWFAPNVGNYNDEASPNPKWVEGVRRWRSRLPKARRRGESGLKRGNYSSRSISRRVPENSTFRVRSWGTDWRPWRGCSWLGPLPCKATLKAKTFYQDFLTLWKDADRRHPHTEASQG